ncbi:MAG TPA: 2-phosphosulfolactate phosphatase, partial [candidate division Zixibacteria bacterium]|nr:2-phosphosulfolactate phosphatase [candidate division Zixibacteria bacterium]
GRSEVPKRGKFSLSPLTFTEVDAGTRVVLYSLNGGSCSEAASTSPHLLLGSLINAEAAAERALRLSNENGKGISVIACGEQVSRPAHEDDFRSAVEDLLGAGAVLAHITGAKSPEAMVCEGAFRHHKKNLISLLWESESGLELRERGFGDDVKYAAQLNKIVSVPVLKQRFFESE